MTKFIQKIKAKFGFIIREGLFYYITTDSVHKGRGEIPNFCEFCLSRILPYFHMSVSPSQA